MTDNQELVELVKATVVVVLRSQAFRNWLRPILDAARAAGRHQGLMDVNSILDNFNEQVRTMQHYNLAAERLFNMRLNNAIEGVNTQNVVQLFPVVTDLVQPEEEEAGSSEEED